MVETRIVDSSSSGNLKFGLFISLVLALFLLSSCSSGSDTGSVSVDLEYDSIYAGPEISSIEVEPWTTVDEGDLLNIIVTIVNKGSQNMASGELRIFGFEDRFFEFDDKSFDGIRLEGYNVQTYGVDFGIYEFEGYAKSILEEASKEEVNVFFELDFGYSTEFSDEICINTDSYNVYGNCENPDPSKKISAPAQYSPVVVTSYQEKVAPSLGFVEFTFFIENKGQGEVEKISVVNAKVTADDMDCDFIGEGEMDGSSYVFESDEQSVELECEYHFDPNTVAQEKKLYLDLYYDYKLSDVKTITIEKAR